MSEWISVKEKETPDYSARKRGTTYQALADKYGVSKKTMQNAINGVTWKCVSYMPEPPKEE